MGGGEMGRGTIAQESNDLVLLPPLSAAMAWVWCGCPRRREKRGRHKGRSWAMPHLSFGRLRRKPHL